MLGLSDQSERHPCHKTIHNISSYYDHLNSLHSSQDSINQYHDKVISASGASVDRQTMRSQANSFGLRPTKWNYCVGLIYLSYVNSLSAYFGCVKVCSSTCNCRWGLCFVEPFMGEASIHCIPAYPINLELARVQYVFRQYDILNFVNFLLHKNWLRKGF